MTPEKVIFVEDGSSEWQTKGESVEYCPDWKWLSGFEFLWFNEFFCFADYASAGKQVFDQPTRAR